MDLLERMSWIIVVGSIGPSMLLTLGILWAPIGSTWLRHLGKEVGLDISWTHGALASVLFLMPWLYLWFRAKEKPINSTTVRLGYVLFLVQWVVGTVVPFVYAAFHVLLIEEVTNAVYNYNTLIWWAIMFAGIALLNGGVVAYAIRSLHSHRELVMEEYTTQKRLRIGNHHFYVLGAVLLAYLLVLPEMASLTLVLLFTSCAECIWE